MQFKNIENKYLFILTLMFFCQGLLCLINWLLYYHYVKEFPINALQILFYFLLVMPPSIISANIYLLSIISKNKVYRIIMNIIGTIIAIFIYCFVSLIHFTIMSIYWAPNAKIFVVLVITENRRDYIFQPRYKILQRKI